MRNAGKCNTPPPGRAAAIGQAGNSMHTEVSCSVITFCLLEVEIDKFARRIFKSGMTSLTRLSLSGGSQLHSAHEEAEQEQ